MADIVNPLTADGNSQIFVEPDGRYSIVVNYTAGTGTITFAWIFGEGNMNIPSASFTADAAFETTAAGCHQLNVNVASASGLTAYIHVHRIN